MTTTDAGRIVQMAIDEAGDPAIAEQIGAAIDAMKTGQLKHVLERYGDQAFTDELISALVHRAAIGIESVGAVDCSRKATLTPSPAGVAFRHAGHPPQAARSGDCRGPQARHQLGG